MELIYLIVDDNEGIVAICDTSEKAGSYTTSGFPCVTATRKRHGLTRAR